MEEIIKSSDHVKNRLISQLISGISRVFQEAKEQKGGFLGILLGILGASLLRNLLTGKGTIRACHDF